MHVTVVKVRRTSNSLEKLFGTRGNPFDDHSQIDIK